jgi:hypothetical protein
VLQGGFGEALNFLAAIFPFPTEGNEKGEKDQFHVEAERLLTNIDYVVTKFPVTRCICRKVNLGEAGQAWGDD